MRKALIPVVILTILAAIQAKSQTSYRTGLMPVLNFNKSVSERWKLNTKVENQILFQKASDAFFKNGEMYHDRTELHFSGSHKLTFKSSITGGYMVRFHEERSYHRFFQRFSMVSQLKNLVLSHRIGLDQTLKPGKSTEYRLRYRFSNALPLNGTEIDTQEGYLKFSNEYLGSLEDKVTSLEIRIKAAYGYELNQTQKAEAGIDYRFGDVASAQPSQTLWLYMGWYVKL